MEQLLNIKTVPISIEIIVHKAELRYDAEFPKVEVTRDRGGLKMQAEPIQIQLDNKRMRESIGMKGIDRLTRDYADDGIRICYQATARFVQEGNQLLDFKHYSPADIAAQRIQRNIETVLSFLPEHGPDISWSGGTLSINYQADELNFNWDASPVGNPSFEFVPPRIEFKVKSYPKVEIEYVGKPIYCPPSADPDYEPEFEAKA
jgi:hypothetical protein